MVTEGEPFDREEYDHKTDEYVSDCNSVPFTKPFFNIREPSSYRKDSFLSALPGFIIVLALLGGGLWVAWILVKKVLGLFL
jgi:hypothetical protein